MVYLHWDARDFGISSADTVKAAYNTLEEAHAQALHDLGLGKRPLRITDEAGVELWMA